jgi:starch phosphorylase
LIEQTLGPAREELGLTEQDFLALGRVDREDASEPFCMTVLGLRMSERHNAVSARHGQVTRAMWQDVWPTLPLDMTPISHVTNGIHGSAWMAVSMAPLHDRHLGPDWRERIDDPQTWAAIDQIDDAEFWEQHQILNAHLIEYVRRCLRRHSSRRGGDGEAPQLDPRVLTIGFARRFAGYKRADLLFHDPQRLAGILNNPQRPVQVVYAGKAHPDNEEGKRLIQELFRMMHEPPLSGRVVFLEDHDMNVGRHLVQGADVWLNTPRRPFEACGTSGQKAVLNGGLNLSVLDGWWAQAYDGQNGFAIGHGAECADQAEQDTQDAAALYDALENDVVPLFYDRDDRGIPHGWIARQKHAIRTLAWRYSALRMVKDYTHRFYVPASGGATCDLAR